ncbi:YeiH family protein [Janibacter alittae]|uniref:Sulfate exporter family transporter n=1 Tax=Janibacter alittae TaxID=3115209 RepID=A0ABZ2MJI2_9MICO
MSTSTTSTVRTTVPSSVLPGLALCLAAAVVSTLVGRIHPVLSPLLVAILLGVALAAIRPLPAPLRPGLDVSGRTLLRAGIVLLGLQLSLRGIAALGVGTVALVLLVVTSGIAVTLAVGRLLGLSWSQRMLIACGFSICGAAAVAAAKDVVDSEDEEVATGIALVVVFGTAMIGIIPLAVLGLGLGDEAAGLWAGASIHEVAQVVAAGGIVSGAALSIAVVVKLARVLMLAPVMAFIGWQQRARATGTGGSQPPLVPPFVIGFIAMVLIGTWLPLPEGVTDVAAMVQTLLLAAAMFALGCGVRFADLRKAGSRPVVLAAVATAWVALVGLGGALLLG